MATDPYEEELLSRRQAEAPPTTAQPAQRPKSVAKSPLASPLAQQQPATTPTQPAQTQTATVRPPTAQRASTKAQPYQQALRNPFPVNQSIQQPTWQHTAVDFGNDSTFSPQQDEAMWSGMVAGTDKARRQEEASYGPELQGSAPTQTGYLNFDRFAAANQGVARRESKRVEDMVRAQAEAAKKATALANDAYMKALGKTGVAGYDASGNAVGGGAGPSIPTAPQGVVDYESYEGTPIYGVRGASQADADVYRNQLGAGAAEAEARAAGIGKFTDTDEYKAALEQSKKADQMLADLNDPAKLAELMGGTGADAALIGQAGQPLLRKLGSDYGKRGLGRDNLTDYLGAYVKEGDKRAGEAEALLGAEGNAYRQALGDFEKRLTEPKAPKQEATPTPKSFSQGVSEIAVPDDPQGVNAGWRGTGDSVEKFPPAGAIASEFGVNGPAANKAWSNFRTALPAGASDYFDAMLGYINQNNITEAGIKENQDLSTEERDRLLGMLGWVSQVQDLFRQYLKEGRR